MDLLLTHGYFLYEDEKELQIMRPYPPLGLLYLCSHLRAKGIAAEVFDVTFSSRQQLFDLLRGGNPSVLGVYANLKTRPVVVEILKAAKEAGWKTIVGGPEPGSYAREYLLAGADVIAIGEGELVLEELLPALREGSSTALAAVKGIAFMGEDGTVHWTPPGKQIANLDTQPWPAREAIDFGKYLEVWRKHHGVASVSLLCARGCPYHCNWCSRTVFGNTHRRRSPALVVDELQWMLERYTPELAWMADDVFTIHHGWLYEYAAEMKRRGLKVPFECISRANRIDPKIADTLAELGCFRIWIGSESGSQRILDAMERGVTVEGVRKAVDLCKSRGIETGMFLMWGYDGEELKDIEASIGHVKHTRPDVFLTTVVYPVKGTGYYDKVSDRIMSNTSWEKGSDRDLQVKGRPSRSFYQGVDRLLRSEVELARLLDGRDLPDASMVEALRSRIAEERSNVHTGWHAAENRQ